MRVSVIICTCNRYESIIETVESIFANTQKPSEILIIDQSDDLERSASIVAALKNPIIQHIQLQVKGQSIARNIGIRESTGDVISFTDDDAFVRNDWIQETLQTFKNPQFNTGIAGGKIIPVYQEINPNWKMPTQWEFILPSYSQEGPMSIYTKGYPPGVNYAIKREVVNSIGYFDERIGLIAGRKNQLFGDDTNFTIRTLNAGFEVVFNPESVVYHPVPLARQSQEFLNKRLFSKGLTDIVINYGQQKPKKHRIVKDYLSRLLELNMQYLKLGTNPQINEGQRALLRGQIEMIKAYLVYDDVFDSPLF